MDSSDKYNFLAKVLESELTQKATLIHFHVLSEIEYSFKFSDRPINRFAVEWCIKIEHKKLIGTVMVSREVVTDSAVDIADVLIRDITNAIINAIISPDTVPEAEIIIT